MLSFPNCHAYWIVVPSFSSLRQIGYFNFFHKPQILFKLKSSSFNLPLPGRMWTTISKRHPGIQGNTSEYLIWEPMLRFQIPSVSCKTVMLCITLQPPVWLTFRLLTSSLMSQKRGVGFHLTLSEETCRFKLWITNLSKNLERESIAQHGKALQTWDVRA